jgi:multiple sugar transport system substrate-binding protein
MEEIMKKVAVLFLALFLTAGMVFAGGGRASGGSSSAAGKIKMTIVGLGATDTERETWNANAPLNIQKGKEEGYAVYLDGYGTDEFNKIKVRKEAEEKYTEAAWEWVNWGWAEPLDAKLRSMIAAGSPPTNVFGETFIPAYATNGMLQEIPADVLVDLDESFFIRDANGKVVALIYKASPFMLWYNKDLFRKAGLDPEKPPKTWDEWKAMSKQITDAGKGEFWGGGIPSWPNMGGSLRATPFFRQNSTDFGIDGKPQLNTPKFQETLQFIRDMNAFIPAGMANGSSEAPLWNAFEKDKILAFAINAAWEEGSMINNHIDYGVAPLPIPAGGKPGNCFVSANAFGVPVGIPKEQADVFWRFIKEVFLKPDNISLFTAYNRMAVPVKAVMDNPDNLTKMPAMEGFKAAMYELSASKVSGVANFPKNNAEVWDILNTQVLTRTTMSNDPISRICSDALLRIEAATR